jgi:hypothetical protein
MIADINGDGLQDIVGFNHYNVAVAYNQSPRPGQLSKIVDGNGIETAIDYQSIAGPNDHYVKQGRTSAGSEDEVIDLQIPLQVVTKVSTSDGLGGSNAVSYRYGGLKAHKQGRGLLGFEWINIHNHQTGFTEETAYSQVFPHIGTPVQTWTETAEGVKISESTSTLAAQSLNEGKTHFPYASYSTTTEKELNGVIVKQEEIYKDRYDDYGNVIDMRTVVSGGGMSQVTANHNTYEEPDLTNWHLGRLIASSVTQSMTEKVERKTGVSKRCFAGVGYENT